MASTVIHVIPERIFANPQFPHACLANVHTNTILIFHRAKSVTGIQLSYP